MTKTLHASGLSFGYSGDQLVLDDVSVGVEPGERVGIIGPNGAGKTTLFMLISGVVAPVAGMLEVFGRPVQPGAFQPEVGMVFHHTNDQLICPTVREDIAFGPQNMGLSADEVEERVMSTASATGITHLLDRTPHELSSGEQRLVSITGILAMMPRLLILDEPTSDLDLRYRRLLVGMLNGMAGHTILMASHDLEFVLETCDRVVLLDEGRVQADGEPIATMSDKNLMEAHGLEVPHSLLAKWHRHVGPQQDCDGRDLA